MEFMDFKEFRKRLIKLKKLCSNTNTGMVDGYRLPVCAWVDEPTKGYDVIPFEDSEWQKFWKCCKKVFPMHSVNNQCDIERGKECEVGFFTKILYRYPDYSFLDKLDNKLLMLEIGCGFGGIGIEMIENHNADYYAIDYCIYNKELLKYKDKKGYRRFIEIKNSGIPKRLMNKKFGLVFSSNCFQHMTRKQRQDYFNQVGSILDDNGIFYFDVFNWNKNYIHQEKKNDVFSTIFFGVETNIETEEEIESMLDEAGLCIRHKQELFSRNNPESNNAPMSYYCIKKKIK